MADFLNEMMEMAISSQAPLADLLRRCLVLAIRLDMDDFEQWAEQELNGYPNKDSLPDYRVSKVRSYGTLSNGFRMEKNHPIPMLSLPEDIRDFVETVGVFESVGAIEKTLVPLAEKDSLRYPWIPDLLPIVSAALTKNSPGGYHLVEAWQLLPQSVPSSILETVRNRVLSFVLQVQKLGFDINSIKPDQVKEVKGPVRDIYNITIRGNNIGNIAALQKKSPVNITQIKKGDIKVLLEQLEDIGISGKDLDELEIAIKGDQEDCKTPHSSFGSRVTGWIGKLTTNVANGVAANLSHDAVNSAVKYIKQYFG